MSIRSRARALAAKAGISYQQAMDIIRKAGAEPADMASRFQWSLPRADAYTVDPDLDDEHRDIRSTGARYVSANTCDNCGQAHFFGQDKKGVPTGGSEQFCPACLEEYGSWECSRCGREVLGCDEDSGTVCSDCWDDVLRD